jgi:hypothetical protein
MLDQSTERKKEKRNVPPHVRLLLKLNGHLIAYKNAIVDQQEEVAKHQKERIDDCIKEFQMMNIEIVFNDSTKRWNIKDVEVATSVDIVTNFIEKVHGIFNDLTEEIESAKVHQEIEIALLIENSQFALQQGDTSFITEITEKNVTKKCLESQKKILDKAFKMTQRIFE